MTVQKDRFVILGSNRSELIFIDSELKPDPTRNQINISQNIYRTVMLGGKRLKNSADDIYYRDNL